MGEYYSIICHTCREWFTPTSFKLREIACNIDAAMSVGHFCTLHPGHHLELRGDEYNYDASFGEAGPPAGYERVTLGDDQDFKRAADKLDELRAANMATDTTHPAPPPDAPFGGTAQPPPPATEPCSHSHVHAHYGDWKCLRCGSVGMHRDGKLVWTPPPATGTPARTLASELHDLVMNTPTDPEKVPPGLDTTVRMAYLYGHRDARHAIAEALIGHPALRQPAPVAADGAGHTQQMWSVVRNGRFYTEPFITEQRAREFAATVTAGARVVPVRVTVLADDAGAEGAETIDWKRKAEEVGAAYTDLLLSHPGMVKAIAKCREFNPQKIAHQIWRDFSNLPIRSAIGTEWAELQDRIARELANVMPPVDVMTAAARHVAALAAPAGGAAGRDGKA